MSFELNQHNDIRIFVGCEVLMAALCTAELALCDIWFPFIAGVCKVSLRNSAASRHWLALENAVITPVALNTEG